MKSKLFCFALLNLLLKVTSVDLVSSFLMNDVTKIMFEDFIKTYNKQYESNAEYETRYNIFVENLEQVMELRLATGSTDYGITSFMDLTFEEFLESQTGADYLHPEVSLEAENVTSYLSYMDEDLSNVPESFDWISKGAVTSVKQQAHCGSCWAFSAIATIEGQYAIKHGDLVDLSEQELLDCERMDHSCKGGYPHVAFNALARLGGCMTYQDYPYTARPGQCRFNPRRVAVGVLGGQQLSANSEDEIKALVVKYGPISVSIYASRALQMFKGPGVFDPSYNDCPTGASNNHAVLIVGYGTEDGKDYWLIKNSWGTQFGDHGFFRLVRGRNACGVQNYIAVAKVN